MAGIDLAGRLQWLSRGDIQIWLLGYRVHESEAMRWARVLTTLLMVLLWAIPEAVHVNIGRCLRLVHLASISVSLPLSAHLSTILLKHTLL